MQDDAKQKTKKQKNDFAKVNDGKKETHLWANILLQYYAAMCRFGFSSEILS
jgi:ribosome recycling factor